MILTVCTDPGIIQFVKIFKIIFQMIQILGPILAMLSLAILFFKMIAHSNEKEYLLYKKQIKNCIIALVITFFLPVFVNLVMSATFMTDTFEVSACWKDVEKESYSGVGTYLESPNTRGSSGSYIINPDEYTGEGTDGNPNGDGGSISANSNDLFSACEEQAEWMKNYKYEYERNPTVEKSKKKGTCVTYVACVLQRIGALKSGKMIWHNGSGYGTGKVFGTTSSMKVIYMNNKSLGSLKSELQAGDIIMVDDNKSGKKGNGGHIFIFAGDWNSKGNPMIYDNHSAENVKKGKSAKHQYSKKRKVLAVVRLSK